MEPQLQKKAQKKLTPLAAREKIKHWCAYQERSPRETEIKLYEYGLSKAEAEQIIAHLIESNFLNEERFALAFAGGKFRIKKWGRMKIKAELKARQISVYSINKALQQIDDAAYETAIKKLLEQKAKSVKEPNKIRKAYKLIQFAASRGFEKDIVAPLVEEMLG